MGADTLIDFQYSIRAPYERPDERAWSIHSHVTRRNARARRQTRVRSPVYNRGQRNDIFARIEITVLYDAITQTPPRPRLDYVRKGRGAITRMYRATHKCGANWARRVSKKARREKENRRISKFGSGENLFL